LYIVLPEIIMKKLADFIVDKRRLILILFVLLVFYSVWGMGQIEVEYDIAAYLPEETDTRRAISIMDAEFEDIGASTLIIENITFEEADGLYEEIKDIPGVKSFSFENTEDYYRESSAKFSITFDGDKNDPVSVAAYTKIIELLEPYEVFVASALTDDFAEMLSTEVQRILVVVVIIITLVILFTSSSYIDFAVFLMTFGVAALLNMGTNFWFGKISFISNSVCVVLQLALAIDYSIILSHRFAEEKELGAEPVEALKIALSKAIVEISSSSLTTIAGLLALTTMTLRLGADMGVVLAKSIVCSMLTVFLFMPGLILAFTKLIDRTKHKSFIPKIPAVGRFAVFARWPIVVIFAVLSAVCSVISFNTEYVYGSNSIDTHHPSESQIASEKLDRVFGYSSEFVVLLPGRDFDRQKELMDRIEAYDEITDAIGLANMEIKMNGRSRYLTERISYREFADLLATDADAADAIYSSYAYLSADGAEDGISELALYNSNKDIYKISLWDLCDVAMDHDDFISAYLYYDSEAYEDYEDLRELIEEAEKQLLGPTYSRMLFVIDGKEESAETFDLISRLLSDVKADYPDAIFAGNSMSSYDLNESFVSDNLKVSILTVAFVFIILMITFRSWGMPMPLALTIQGAIFINFSYYGIVGSNQFFFVYLIISAIQMGATIDYAIVITNRFVELKGVRGKKEALVTAVSDAFPTVLTSGLIMSSAGFLIGEMVTEPMISTMGSCLGRGVIVSIAAVMLVLPALLYIFDTPISKTVFKRRQIKIPGFVSRLTRLTKNKGDGNFEK